MQFFFGNGSTIPGLGVAGRAPLIRKAADSLTIGRVDKSIFCPCNRLTALRSLLPIGSGLLSLDQVHKFYVAGAFGTFLDPESAVTVKNEEAPGCRWDPAPYAR